MSTSRIIPTCVGKTQMKVLLVLPKQDHPHLCGENDILKSLRKSKGGSSPLVWGKPTGMLVQGDERRIIPTCVGKTVTSISLPHMIQDHPHLCGENPNALANPYDLWGSSPLVWGKPNPMTSLYALLRIIPTCVGKTTTGTDLYPHSQDHPHLCGENRSSAAAQLACGGSSPLVWGKRVFFL